MFLKIINCCTYLVSLCIPLLFLASSIGKLLQITDFSTSLYSFTLLPKYIQSLSVTLVPGVELLPVLFIIIKRPKTANMICLLMLCLFTGVVYWHWLHNVKPDCACFGLWGEYIRLNRISMSIFIRNGILAAISVLSILLSIMVPAHNKLNISHHD